MEMSGQLHAPATLLPGKEPPDTHWIGGWLGSMFKNTLWHNLNARGCIQKYRDWPPGARTANDTALCHYLQFYRYFV